MPRPVHSGPWRALLNARPVSGGGYVPISSPKDIPGLQAWWSSYEAAVEGYVDGNTLTQLKDYSGNLNHWNQANAGQRGVWKDAVYSGFGCIRLDNSDDGYVGTYTPGASPQLVTVAVVYAARADVTATRHIVGSKTGAGPRWAIENGWPGTNLVRGTWDEANGSFVKAANGNYTNDVGVLRAAISTHGAVNRTLWVNGCKVGAIALSNTPEVVDIGYSIDNVPAYADIVEVAVWNRELTDAECTDLMIYWHLTWGLPEAFNDQFSTSAAVGDVNGYASAAGIYSQLGGTHTWAGSPWVATNHYRRQEKDNAQGHAAGTNINGLTAAWNTVMVGRGTTHDIYNRTFGGTENDNRFRISGSGIAWPMPWGSDWERVRLYMLICTTDAGGAPVAGTRFAYGVCAGTTAIPGDVTPAHFVGASSSPTGLGLVDTWSYSAGVSYRYYPYAFKCENGVWTPNATGYMGSNYLATDANANVKRYGMAVEVFRSVAPAFDVRVINAVTSDVIDDEALFEEEMQGMSLSFHALSTWRYSVPASKSLNVDEATYGSLNSFCIWWQGATFDMEISEIMFERSL